ncbi:MAG: AbrB/MazE/SpoVT family DNA-binding domain-containing protein [Elusimicrobia bacterium]|nr:AbrB/MazE/SpoVT family DNA-binding domain-containing protein [Elusimicrobiota bacterium]
MERLTTATVTSKAQITLPKSVREALGVGQPGDLVGFLIDSDAHVVKLTRVEAVPVDEEFTEAEYRKLKKFCGQRKDKKTFKSMEALIKDLKS